MNKNKVRQDILLKTGMNRKVVAGKEIFAGTELGGVFKRPVVELTGIEELQIESSFAISPNPFTSQTTITFSEAQKNTSIKVMNTLGECIQQLTTSNKQLTIDMSGLAKGVYFVQITDANKNVVNKKVIKE